MISIGTKIQSQVQSELDKAQREYFLRQQLKAIQEELGEGDEMVGRGRTSCASSSTAIDLPEDVRKQADRELSRLERLPPAAAEHGVIRTYLEWIASLPWDKSTEDNLDLKHARKVLDEDHYDIEQVKDRILEFLAVRKLKPDARGSILCFVGPPGVGKTSLGRSIARALGRKFERISVGGVRDEAEIRGHRRTYIGAMPGTIIRALRDAGSNNPLFMIDEIDKMGADYRGDPASALLEVLDPEQNSTLPRPLPRRAVRPLARHVRHHGEHARHDPRPLRDRMEVIQLAGYTEEEKLEIAKRYLVPRQIERNGLKKSQIDITDAGLRAIIADYTREAGVRNLEREIGTICRKVAAPGRRGQGQAQGLRDREARARAARASGASSPRSRRRTQEPGVATGLAWTPAGGDVLFIEATAMPGTGKLTITGQLGDVMKESGAGRALLRAQRTRSSSSPTCPRTGSRPTTSTSTCPRARSPKDGPSAGITMATALMSLITGRPVRDDVAMTGEITLTGQVLPIGGLKEKALAAQRNGITARDRAQAQRARHRGDPRAPAQGPRVPCSPARSARSSSLLSRAGRRRRSPRFAATAGAPRRRTAKRREAATHARAKPRSPACGGGYSHSGTAPPNRERESYGSEKRRPRKAGSAAASLRENPYIQRIIEDAELRNRIRGAYESTRSAYGRLNNGKAPTKALMEDKKLQRELREAAASLRDAGQALREGPKRKKRSGGLGRKLLVLAVGAGLAMALSEGLRQKVLDALFGAEEEFDYTSTTTPAPPRPRRPPRPRTRRTHELFTRAPSGAPSSLQRRISSVPLAGWPV